MRVEVHVFLLGVGFVDFMVTGALKVFAHEKSSCYLRPIPVFIHRDGLRTSSVGGPDACGGRAERLHRKCGAYSAAPAPCQKAAAAVTVVHGVRTARSAVAGTGGAVVDDDDNVLLLPLGLCHRCFSCLFGGFP